MSRTEKNKYVITRREALKLGTSRGGGPCILTGSADMPAVRTQIRRRQIKRAPAKAVIELWMSGGPSHLDTFDPKPEAGNDYCGPFKNSDCDKC